MGLIHKKILGVEVTFSRKAIILKEIEKYLTKIKNQKSKIKKFSVKPLVIFTPNPEIISFAGKDKKFMEIVNTAQINLPDSGGVVWAAEKIFGEKIKKISGSDFVWDLTELAVKKGFTVGLIGGRNGVALETNECLKNKYPRLKTEVLGEPEIKIQKSKSKNQNYSIKFEKKQFNNRTIEQWDGQYLDKTISETVKKIGKKKIDILFVALGFPKQEYFIEEVNRQLSIVNCQNPLVLMSVGGTFDYISGKVQRAPLFIRNMGFEWLYRLIREPQRLGRQIKGMKFFWDIFTS